MCVCLFASALRLRAVHCLSTCRILCYDCKCGSLVVQDYRSNDALLIVALSIIGARATMTGRAGGGFRSSRPEWRASAFPTRFSQHRHPRPSLAVASGRGWQRRGRRKVLILSIASIIYSGLSLERKLKEKIVASVGGTLPLQLHQSHAEV